MSVADPNRLSAQSGVAAAKHAFRFQIPVRESSDALRVEIEDAENAENAL
ncbi:MAG: hypothetical protein ABI167_00800 [Nitrosospira sp.]